MRAYAPSRQADFALLALALEEPELDELDELESLLGVEPVDSPLELDDEPASEPPEPDESPEDDDAAVVALFDPRLSVL